MFTSNSGHAAGPAAHGAGPGHQNNPTPPTTTSHAHANLHTHGLPMSTTTINSAGVDMTVFDQDLNFDESLLDGVNGLAPLPFTPSYEFENFNTFEDPFSSYSARPAYHVPADSTEPFNEESPSQELDNKLLSFSAPVPRAQLVDGAGTLADPNMSAELYGMFFVAEDVFGGDTSGRPLELTCYRRNLWQCSGQITLPRNMTHIMDEQSQQQVQIFDLAASITAIESIEGKPTEIISIPWKSAGDEGSKSPAAPPNIALDLSTGQELDQNRVSLPVSWKRLQFKHATANNGRRKGLQQHYVVQISLLGKAKTGEYLKLADIQSGPVIVRGRSPRNFDSRKDVPLSGDKKAERRATMTPSDTTPVPKVERSGELAQNLQKYHSLGNVQQSGDWASPHPYVQPGQSSSKKLALSPTLNRPPVPSWSSEPSMPKPGQPTTPRSNSFQRAGVPSSLPINLSLSEDERSPNRSSSDCTSPRHATKSMAAGQNLLKSPEDDEEQLYEYFPLSLDDWQQPVDAIYRPHVVHHVFVPPELRAQQVRNRTKRYFSSD